MILGKTQVDQDWIDGEVEVGVAVCGFPRPGPRPAALDTPATRQVPAAAPPAKRPGIFKRLKQRLRPKVANAQAAGATPAPMRSQPPIVLSPPPPAPAPVASPEPPRAVPPPPPPQDPVDALLHPRK